MEQIRLLWIELHKYKLLDVSNIQTIKISFKERFHWIMGSNGSGKSSILKECSPLDFKSKNFHEGGYKKTRWLVGNKEYELISTKGAKKDTHNFIVFEDGLPTERNIGHTSRVQRSLVEEVFNVTRESHLVATGKLRLTNMDPGERKTLFTNLSSVDYTYALGYYKRLYSAYRDLLGSRKIDQNRLVEIKSIGVDPQQEIELLAGIKELKGQIDALMELRPKLDRSSQEAYRQVNEINLQIRRLYDKTNNYLASNKHYLPLEPIENLRKKLNIAEFDYERNEESMDNVYRKFEKLVNKVNEVTRTTGLDKDTLLNQKSNILEELNQIEYSIISGETSLTPMSKVIDDAYAEYIAIREEMFSLDPEEVGEFHRYRSRFSNLQEQHRRQTEVIWGLKCSLEELKSHEHKPNTECPQCGHSFNPAFSELKKKNLEEAILKEEEKLKVITPELEEAHSDVKKMEAYLKGQELWGNLIRKYPQLNDLWGKAIREKLCHLDAFGIDPLFTHFRFDLTTLVKEKKLLEELKIVQDKLTWLEKVSENNLCAIQEELKESESRLVTLEERRRVLSDDLSILKMKVALSTGLKKAGEEAARLKALLESSIIGGYDNMEYIFINDLIRKIDSEIVLREEKLRAVHSKTSEVLRLEKMLQDTSVQIDALKDALQVLSPTDGLIAKGLTGFINHFTGLMNSILERIVTYTMKFQPIATSSEDFELDFKMPILVKDILADDISECSTGQSEIIDLAFKILYLKFKRLDTGILALDEFGSHLDHVHQQKAYDAVRHLLSTTNFSQVLMISHLSGSYSLMDNASSTMLCPANVFIPDGVTLNDTSEITYY